jgi:Cytochrome c554 and c-prime
MLKLWNMLLFLLLLVLSRSLQSQQRLATAYVSNSSGYVGDQACRSCHQQETNTYFETAHHLTSQMPSEHSILGKFSAGENILRTSNPALHYEMTESKEGYFETAVGELSPFQEITRTERIDIVVGSGRKGQTYLFWRNNELFELPVSYWTDLDSWIISPGYHDDAPDFHRGVVPRCLECHAGRFGALRESDNSYDPSSLVFGITCERCHGAGGEHVLLRRSKTAAIPQAQDPIVNPASLPRDRQVDICASCHSGQGHPLAPALSFIPGKVLQDYLRIPYQADAPIDVHGNQTQLLARSRCFRGSTMTCTTCHDVHKLQRDATSFSPHCLTCHKVKDCGKFKKLGAKINNNCVDCHMPVEGSNVIVSDTNGRTVKARVRNHEIRVYPEAQAQ